jgi:c-di-GMP-binding flagellar brake protein YcgR
LSKTIDELMSVAPRTRIQTEVKLRPEQANEPFVGVTENISMTGMLIAGTALIPRGDSFDFQLKLKEKLPEIRGTARVVRHTDEKKEFVNGFGASFEKLEGAGNEVLASFMLLGVA